MTTLRDITDALGRAGLLRESPDPLPEITGIADDSRHTKPGDLFCAVEGSTTDGHAYLKEAGARGAAAALVTRRSDLAVPQVLVRASRPAAALAAATWYGRPGDALRLIGVTGTNGKSTTVALVRHLLNAGGNVAALGTLGGLDGAGVRLPAGAGLTTPGPVELHAALDLLRRRGATTVAMEASSHALHQGRLAELPFCGAIYTNLTREHLDYHGDLDAYRSAKLLLSTLLGPDGTEIVNADDPAWRALPPRPGVRRVWFGRAASADVCAVEERHTAHGSRVTMRFARATVDVTLPLLGEFNVSNALAAAAAAWSLGCPAGDLAAGLAQAPQVAGRMERLGGDGFTILRDYAHTPDAFERVLATLRPLTAGRLVILFGAGGDRDRGKRSVMAEIAARLADLVVITSDNPRTENEERILDDLETGLGAAPHHRIRDREEAIHRAIALLQTGDCLLLAGKGHETYQIIGTTKHPFDERRIVQDALGRSAA